MTALVTMGIAFTVRELFSGQAELTLLEGVLIWQSLVGGFLIIQTMLRNKVMPVQVPRKCNSLYIQNGPARNGHTLDSDLLIKICLIGTH